MVHSARLHSLLAADEHVQAQHMMQKTMVLWEEVVAKQTQTLKTGWNEAHMLDVHILPVHLD